MINGWPFSIDTDDYTRNFLASYVSAVGTTAKYQFNDSSSTARITRDITIWVRNGVVTQVLISSAPNFKFMCVEKTMLSTNNWWAGGAYSPAYTIPACTGITISSFPGEGMLIFNFNNFILNVAPSVFVTPIMTITLNGTLVAKGR